MAVPKFLCTALSLLSRWGVQWQPQFCRQQPTGISNEWFQEEQGGECRAREVHLSLGEKDEMVLMWRTHEEGCGSKVMYGRGEGPNHAHSMVLKEGEVLTVQGEDMCGEPANEEDFIAYLHRAVLKITLDHSSWWYQIQGSNHVYKFKSPPETKADSGFSFIAFGDMGQADDKHDYPGAGKTVDAIAEEMERRPVDLLIHAGDLSYASGSHHGWNHFMDSIEPFASRAPYMVSIGNYDYGYEGDGLRDPSGAGAPWFQDTNDSGGECGVMSAARFSMPGVHKGDNPPFWYSYDYGNMHFTVISSEHDCAPGSEQYRWLDRDLSSVNRCKTPWLALVMHRPMYVVHPHNKNRKVGEQLRGMLEPLLLHHRVDLTLSGHVHTYFRTCAVEARECRDSGITHFIAGTAGHELTSMKKGLPDSWAEEGCNDFGFLRFDVSWKSLQAQFIRTTDGKTVDKVTMRTKDGICKEWA